MEREIFRSLLDKDETYWKDNLDLCVAAKEKLEQELASIIERYQTELEAYVMGYPKSVGSVQSI